MAGKRTWGFWTRGKLNILEKYLNAFLVASRTVDERIYLDAFAGEGHGIDRITGADFKGSARIALEAGDPPFTKLRYFELDNQARQLEASLMKDFPDRDLAVYSGDCNETIGRALADLKSLRWAPTFAFLDPDGMEVAWSTLVALANHKRGYRSPGSAKPENKVEIWMLFPTAGLIRTLALDPAKVKSADEDRAGRLFGGEEWRPILELRRAHEIDGTDAREEYLNLMRWQLQEELGYQWTHPFEIKTEHGNPLYHMILATDNKAGTKILSDLYTSAGNEFPKMREEARRQRGLATQERLFEWRDGIARYAYEPPWDPPIT